jgi:hypothetical protein
MKLLVAAAANGRPVRKLLSDLQLPHFAAIHPPRATRNLTLDFASGPLRAEIAELRRFRRRALIDKNRGEDVPDVFSGEVDCGEPSNRLRRPAYAAGRLIDCGKSAAALLECGQCGEAV